MPFPKDFIWGAASAAAQIEGGYLDDGRTPSIWDNMPEGKIKRNENCHIACDHYHHYKEDVQLMKEIGMKAYRLSISWSRVVPRKNEVNEKGLKFYDNLIDELVSAGIKPMITLYHSDMPQWVLDQGGFDNEESIEDFAFYVKTVCERLSDRVEYWFTMNEPQCMLNDLVHTFGCDESKTYRGLLLAHGKAVKTLRKFAKRPLKVSIVMMGLAIEPVPGMIPEGKTDSITYGDAAGYMGMVRWTDPMYSGVVPESVKGILSEEDLMEIHQPLDIFCLNVYGSMNYYDQPGRKNPLIYPGFNRSQIGMPFRPMSLYYSAKDAYKRYNLPILFTENGYSSIDFVMMDGKVHDTGRIDYIRQYLLALEKTIDENVPVIGYMYWSIMDNFEWFHGYDMRFGLIYIDYRDNKRTPKESSKYYSKIIKTNGEYLKENDVY